MMFDRKRILFLGPHTDDIEFGCGATIAKLQVGKNEIICHAFSPAEKSVPDDLPKDINVSHMFHSLKMLGVATANISVGNYPVREFPYFRQQILEDMVCMQRELKPDIVFIPSSFDTHQDHQIVSQEGFRAYKKTILIGYEIPWNNLSFRTEAFSIVNSEQVEKKIEALQCYISQLGRSYVTPEFIRSLARTRGGQVGTEFAEAFEIIRWIM
jgi:LmbE family N-acetylglucosaminyl deacetylase